MGAPVFRGCHRRGRLCPGDVGDQLACTAWGLQIHSTQHPLQLTGHAAHQGGVECVGDLQSAVLQPNCLDDLHCGAFRTSNDGQLWSVGSCNGHVGGRGLRSDGILHDTLWSKDRDHDTSSGLLLHEPGALCQHQQGVLQCHHAGQAGGHDLSKAVPHDHLRLYAMSLQDPGQCVFHSKQCRLGIPRLVDVLSVLRPEQ